MRHVALLTKFRLRFPEVLGDPESDNAGDQVKRKWLIQRKLHRAGGGIVASKLGHEFEDYAGSWIEADMVLQGGIVDQVAFEIECGHLVADLLGGIGSGRPDDCPNLFQQ